MRPLRRWLRANEVIKLSPYPIGLVSSEKRKRPHSCSEERLCEVRARRQPLQAKETGLRRFQSCQNLGPGCLASRMGRESVVEVAPSAALGYGSVSRVAQMLCRRSKTQGSLKTRSVTNEIQKSSLPQGWKGMGRLLLRAVEESTTWHKLWGQLDNVYPTHTGRVHASEPVTRFTIIQWHWAWLFSNAEQPLQDAYDKEGPLRGCTEIHGTATWGAQRPFKGWPWSPSAPRKMSTADWWLNTCGLQAIMRSLIPLLWNVLRRCHCACVCRKPGVISAGWNHGAFHPLLGTFR